MFYPNKIKNIQPGEKVLEIGPGNTPFHRSDVLLELEYKDDKDRIAQFGHSEKLMTDKKICFYDGKKFPFEDKSFDYIICSHVLEHVEDVDFFLSEIFRVGKKGYFEYPLMTYDYLYNFDVHLNFLKFDGQKLFLMKKNQTPLNYFAPVNSFFLQTLNKGYGDFLGGLPEFFFEGFEWNEPFSVVQSSDLNDFMRKGISVVSPKNNEVTPTVKTAIKQLIKSVKNKLT